MRKFLSLLMATFFSAGLFAVTYTVAGSKAILGSEWKTDDTNNDMELVDGVYTLVKEGVTLGQNTYEYKVAQDHAWTNAWPAQNAKLAIAEDGTYDVTFTFVESTKVVNAVAEKKGSAVVEKHYLVVGQKEIANGQDWNNDADANVMATADNGVTYTLTIEDLELTKATDYQYKIVEKGSWTEYFPNLGGPNATFSVEETAKYTIKYVFTVATSKCEVQTTKSGDVEPGGGGDDPQPETKYFMKNNWNGGEWSWKEMAAAEDNTFKLEKVVFGGTGVNYNTEESDTGAEWVEVAAFDGDEVGALDTVTFVLDLAAEKKVKAILLGKYQEGQGGGDDPQPGTKYFMKNNWNGGEDWTWKEMAAAEDNTFKLEKVVFGGTGVNYNTAESDEGAEWVEVAAFDGDEIGALDTVTFILDLAAEKKVKAILLGKYQEGQGGGDDPQPGTKYFMKNNWNGGEDWTWKEMAAAEDNTFKLEKVVFGGTGVNYNTAESDEGAEWVEVAAFDGDEIGALDTVTFILDLAAEKKVKAILLGKYQEGQGGGDDPQPEVTYLLIGSDPAIGGESWDGSKAVALVDGKATVTLQAGECEFKVVPSDWNWDNALGFAQVDADCSSKGISEGDNGNVKVTLAEAGDMTVEVKEGKLCVTGNFVAGGDDPQPEVTYLLIGSDPAIGGESWDGSKAVALVDGKATVTLQAGECEFKVVPSDWNWDNALGFAQVDAECSSEGISEGDNGNVKITMAEAGEMTVEVKDGKLCVTGNFVTGGDDPQPVTPDGIYLSGSFCNWEAKAEYKFARNEAAEGEEYVLSTTLAENDQVKVVEIVNGVWGWYPDGMDNAYTVDADHAGNVTIYFQKTYKEDWAAFGGYIYIAVSGTGVSNTVNDVKAQKFIENGQLFIIVNGATYTVMGQIR